MAGPEGFSNPFENPNTDRTFSAIGSGRTQVDGDKNGSSTASRTEGHSPTSRSDLLQQSKKAPGEMSAIVIRNLPLGMSAQTLRGMLLFSRDCESCEFIKSGSNDDTATAMARFRSADGALQAKELLNGRAIDGGSELRVEVVDLTPGGSAAIGGNYWPVDVLPSADGIGVRTSSKFGDTFREIDRASGRAADGRNGPDGITDGSSPKFGPVRFNDHSPIGHGQRVSGRSVIQQDGGDDDTTRLFGESINFLSPENQHLLLRRATAPTIPSGLQERFGGLSINSNVGNGSGLVSPPSSSGVASPRGFGPAGGMYSLGGLNGLQQHQHRGSISNIGSPTSRFPPPGIQSPNGSSATSAFPSNRHGQLYPPVNPADQNPPCNTLYVGNLPLDTSEDELKALFSKQRGYKRLCFRTKQNGPMCFVEFEEIHYAAGALKELYGTVLSNSVRGGIRLSFSKNPLGVRGPPQQTPISPNQSIHSPASMAFGSGSMNPIGFGNMAGQSFATASGPPPGLPAPMTYQNTRGSVSGHNGASTGGSGSPAAFNSGRDLRNGSFSNYFAGR